MSLLPHGFKQGIRAAIRRVTGFDVRIASNYNLDEQTYFGNDWGLRRTLHFERLLQQVEDIDGVIVECGVGAGTSIFNWMLLTKTVARPRKVWGYDTFKGIPEATQEDGHHNRIMTGAWNYSQRRVRELLRFNGLNQDELDAILFIEGEVSRYTAGLLRRPHCVDTP